MKIQFKFTKYNISCAIIIITGMIALSIFIYYRFFPVKIEKYIDSSQDVRIVYTEYILEGSETAVCEHSFELPAYSQETATLKFYFFRKQFYHAYPFFKNDGSEIMRIYSGKNIITIYSRGSVYVNGRHYMMDLSELRYDQFAASHFADDIINALQLEY